jgi:vancomycin resistance protein YoaR
VVAASVVVVLFLLAVGERVVHSGDVMPGVAVAGTSLGGHSERDAQRQLDLLAARLESEPVRVQTGDLRFAFAPGDVGFRIDTVATEKAAQRSARSANPIDQTLGFLLRRVRPDEVALVARWDHRALDRKLAAWSTAVAHGVVEGGLRFRGTRVIEVAPRGGRGIDLHRLHDRVVAALQSSDRVTIDAPRRAIGPTVDRAAVARAARRARMILRSPKVIAVGARSITLEPTALASAMTATPHAGRLVLGIDPNRLATSLGTAYRSLVDPPVDAAFAVDGTAVSVVPSRDGRAPDMRAIVRGILAGRARIAAPVVSVHPARTTAWAHRLGITHLVSTFTTHYPAGQARVTNIHRAADLLDGTVVEPGAVFSMNDTIGPRTPERGFVAAPAYKQEFVLDVGGGVSQLATTTYNAEYYGGYEDVTHKPHSIWFDRYPMVVEATVDYPTLDLKFRNNTSHGLLIETSYSATSVTVSFYGDNGGKQVTSEGPTILKTTPPADQLIDWPLLPLGQTEQIEHGYTGYDAEVVQVITQPGHPTIRRRWFWRYDMLPNRILKGTAPPTSSVPSSSSSSGPTTSPPTTAR